MTSLAWWIPVLTHWIAYGCGFLTASWFLRTAGQGEDGPAPNRHEDRSLD